MDERRERISQMFANSSKFIGIAPFTKDSIANAMENMKRIGVFTPMKITTNENNEQFVQWLTVGQEQI